MRLRTLGKTGYEVSEVGFGAWAIGGDWGESDDDESLAALGAAVDAGVTFVDTADVYGDGRSEQLVGRLLRERGEPLVVATKTGRRGPVEVETYRYENLRSWIERSLENLGVEALDLVQLHSPPWEVYYSPEVFETFDRLVDEGLMRAYGVSVERVEEGLKALEYPGVASVQIIFNIFRQRPAELFFAAAQERNVGVIVRVPLASGLLSGKFDPGSTFAADDHRSFNRHGESFDVGETFAGVDFERGLEVVDALRPLVPDGGTMAQLALRWILDFEAVSTVIPGARTPEQARANAAAADLPPLSAETHRRIAELYRERVAPLVHQRW
ncbi:MAG TPA: aldo/keto reductase [Gaiellaceae bacterium]|jgi:aryl-alcohol dehydrogenase-like predicted oxidoreductase